MKNISNVRIRLILFLVVFISYSTYSQISRNGIPFTIHRVPNPSIHSLALPFIDNSVMKNAAKSLNGSNCTDCNEKYYGKGIDISIDIKTEGELELLPDNSRLWLLRVSSTTAYGMQFYFDRFHLPYGATLYIYNEDRTSILGAFTSDNNNPISNRGIQFGTEWIKGNAIYLEYHEPNNPEFNGDLRIVKVVHIFNDLFNESASFFGNSLSCNINAVCSLGWEKEINSVALILAYDSDNELFAQCSGSMINNTNQDGRPLFLSANHCIDIPDNGDPNYNFLFDYSTWLFLFNYQTITCNSDGSDVSSSTSQSVYGSTLLAHDWHNSPNSDYLLLELNTSKEVLSTYGVCYAGWTLSNPQPPFTGIHHPGGDVKKISSANMITDFSTTHWEVNWDQGTTEGGSSGSPLFDNDHHIIGQVHYGKLPIGAVDNCDPNKVTGYGKFSKSWQLGNFAYWLDPYSTGLTNISTYCTSNCYDGVMNGSETGIDCGGSCPPCNNTGGGNSSPCKVITYQINSENTNTGNIINVCKNNIIISPFNYIPCTSGPEWLFTDVHARTNHIPCYLSTPGGLPDYCFTDLFPWGLLGIPDNSCVCFYRKLFFAVQQCDENKNLIGTEYSYWFDYLSGFSSFSLNSYLPPGASIQEGKFYKIKVASTAGGIWSEHSSFIRVYSDNLLIQNKVITHDQFANSITITNSTVPSYANIKAVAKTEIKTFPNTALGSGSYYIQNFDCNDLDQFRMLTNNNSITSNSEIINKENASSDSYASTNYSSNLLNEENLENKAEKIKIYPNPATNEINIEFEIENNQPISADIFNINTNFVGNIADLKIFEKGVNTIKYNCSEISNGVYFIKIRVNNETITKKVVILHK
ncbi:MAG: hypothetical protein A3F72_18630 [Bacteroidetes bacterium RIFCSPLOWO2_12_FULL_35_15]|nr:MAG: hypothetical protein A3F72_18630 [Bacteroidetes bacterium RIFCSPLOWO2_12_FULL_35_15]